MSKETKETLIELLMNRDSSTREQVLADIAECREAMLDAIEAGDDPEEVLQDLLCVEPDYIQDVLDD